MNKEIGVGLLVGLVATSSIYIWNSRSITKPQKIILLVCILFPPAQWILLILILFYNRYNGKIKNSFQFQKQEQVNPSETKHPKSWSSQIENLKFLKEQKVLTEEEFSVKKDLISEQIVKEKVKSLKEYNSLKDLYENEILTKEQYEKKLKDLHRNYKTFYLQNDSQKNNLFFWELHKATSTDKNIDINSITEQDLLGVWKVLFGKLSFYHDKNINKYKLRLTKNNGNTENYYWDFKNAKILLRPYQTGNNNLTEIKIDSLGTTKIYLKINDKQYSGCKIENHT